MIENKGRFRCNDLIYYAPVYSNFAMTMLVGIKYAQMALLFADTRLAAGTSRYIHLDGFSKLYCLDNGFVAAAGLRGATTEKVRVLRRARNRNGAAGFTIALNRPYRNLICNATRLIFDLKNYLITLTVPLDIRGNSPKGPPELYLFPENDGFKPREYHKGDPCVIWPYGLETEIKERLAIKYFSGINGNGKNTIQDVIEHITAFYAETARFSPLISPDCRFAAFQTNGEGSHLRGIGYSKVNKEGDIVRRLANLPKSFNHKGWIRPGLVEKYIE